MEDREMTNAAFSVPIFEYHDLSDDPGDTNPFHAPYILARKKFYDQMKSTAEYLKGKNILNYLLMKCCFSL